MLGPIKWCNGWNVLAQEIPAQVCHQHQPGGGNTGQLSRGAGEAKT